MKPDDIIKKMFTDRKIRTATVRRSHYWFFHFYFSHYVVYETAPFQREMFSLTEDSTTKMLVIVAFRGSAKSTIMTMSYPLWAILGNQQKKFVVILGQTQQKAQLQLLNIKRELEGNELLKQDLGPFQEERNQWGAQSLVIKRFNSKISAGSVEQSIRGMRHIQHRPDLIIIDDAEDLASVKTKEGREKVYAWLTGDVIPAGDRNTRFIIIGNLLHEDSFLRRLQRNIQDGTTHGISREFPILDKNNRPLWPGKFPSEKEITQEKRLVMSAQAWQREYLLRIIPEEGQDIKDEWIQYYNKLPEPQDIIRRGTGIDLAISKNATADHTAMVSGYSATVGGMTKIFIMPNPIFERLSFHETIVRAESVSRTLGDETLTELFVEDVAYQRAAIEEMQRKMLPVTAIKPGKDKRARLQSISGYIQQGVVLFPRKGCEDLILQLTGFGVEESDDLMDAFVYLIMSLAKGGMQKQEIIWL